MRYECSGIYKSLRRQLINEPIALLLTKLCYMFDDLQDEDLSCGEEIDRNRDQLANFHKIEFILNKFQNFANEKLWIQHIYNSNKKLITTSSDQYSVSFLTAMNEMIDHYSNGNTDILKQLNLAVELAINYLASWKVLLEEKINNHRSVSMRM